MNSSKITVKPAEERKLCIFLFFFVSSIFLLFFNGHYGGDGLESYLTAESIVLDKDLSIHDRPFQVSEMRYAVRGHKADDGKIYSNQGLAMPLALSPFYMLGYLISNLFHGIPRPYISQFCVSMSNPLIMAFASVILFKLLRELQFNLKVSLGTVFLYSFCTMNIIYVRSGFAEPLVCLFLLLSVLYVLRYEKYSRLRNMLLASVFLCLTIFIKKNSLIFLPPYVAYLIYLNIKYRQRFNHILYVFKFYSAFIIPLLFSVGLIMMQNILLYGGIFNTEFGSAADIFTVATSGYGPMPKTFDAAKYGNQFIRATFYFLISSGKGYLIYNIIFLPAIFGILPAFFRKYRAIMIFIAALVLCVLIFYIQRFIRGSLFSWGPRYLFPTLPFMAVFLAIFIEESKTAARRGALYILAAIGFLIQLPALFINCSAFIFFVKEKLQLQEYLMDFLPELSPIRGTWFLFISFIKRKLSGESLHFSFNPDIRMVEPKLESLAGYDTLDVWWANILKVAPRMWPFVLILIAVLLITIIVCSYKIKSTISKVSTAEG
ncbi:MAG: hypothetical protein PHQ96_00255 [Candidatus Omnitrophica bacterium]|nr:hypothetical protein [Candidatus Omnitrophota bacterium]